jgi:hypothetical protein
VCRVGPYNVMSQHYRIVSVLESNVKIVRLNVITNIRISIAYQQNGECLVW